jgi:transcriptional regulator with XRE-family HTH domain
MAKWEQLIAARERISLSQAEAAERLVVGLTTYQKWEAGKARPQPRNRRRLSEVFPTLAHPVAGEQETKTGAETCAQLHINPRADLSQAQDCLQSTPVSSAAPAVSTPLISLTVSNLPEETDQTSYFLEPKMLDALWTPAFMDHLTGNEKRSAIRQALKECDKMNTSNKNYQITRREAIRALARLPMITLGLTIPGTIVQMNRYGDALAHCAAAFEGCWELWQGNNTSDILLAFQYVSKYLPLLKTIARDSSLYRKDALHLAAQYAVLQTLLGRVCVGLTEATWYAKEAVALSKETDDIALRLRTYVVLGHSYVYVREYALARAAMQEGESVLQRYQHRSNIPPLPSSVIGNFYSAYALVQAKNGECPDSALGIATGSAPSNGSISFMGITQNTHFTQNTQIREASLICCSKGDQTQAMKWIEKRIDSKTLVPRVSQNERGRMEMINILTLSLLKSKERDMEQIIHHWTAAIEGTKALKHELGFSQAVANFEAMEYTFPGEKRIVELRDHIVHW